MLKISDAYVSLSKNRIQLGRVPRANVQTPTNRPDSDLTAPKFPTDGAETRWKTFFAIITIEVIILEAAE